MAKTRLLILTLLALFTTLPARSATYKNTFSDACGAVWGAVKDTLADPQHYNVKNIDDTGMKADYAPKHEVHFDVSGVVLQRENHVTLAPKGPGCEMQVVSNYSGWGHNDQGDFKKRVEEALAKRKSAPASTAAPAQATPAK
jgi:hypothetical protein